MAFVKVEKVPDDTALLRDTHTLAGMSDSQFEDEVGYWQAVRGLGGFLHLQLAGTMLRVMQRVDMCRKSVILPPDQLITQELAIKSVLNTALAGLALSQLLRRAEAPLIERGVQSSSSIATGVDMQLDSTPAVALLHQPKDRMSEIIPAYQPGIDTAWYEDDALVVRTHEPATPTTYFQQRFEAAAGQEFDALGGVTLRPRLKVSFIQLQQ